MSDKRTATAEADDRGRVQWSCPHCNWSPVRPWSVSSVLKYIVDHERRSTTYECAKCHRGYTVDFAGVAEMYGG